MRVHTRVVEGDKERIQIFSGIVIGRKGRGLNETFTVRRISYGEGVERVFPIHSPRIAKVEVEKQGRARRAKLNYLRNARARKRPRFASKFRERLRIFSFPAFESLFGNFHADVSALRFSLRKETARHRCCRTSPASMKPAAARSPVLLSRLR